MVVDAISRTPVKVTYLDRQKRKRTISDQPDANSDTSSDTPSMANSISPTKSISRSSRKSPKPTSSFKAPASKGPKKIDLRDLPGPSPKRPRRDSGESQKLTPSAPQGKKLAHARSSSSITSLNRVIKKVAATPAAKKPRSSLKGDAAKKPVSKVASIVNSIEDDNTSIADSVPDSIISTNGARITRTVNDRQEYFKNQSDCGAFGPHRALCTRCKQFVNLSRQQQYAVGPWEKHRTKCDQALASDKPLPKDADDKVNAPVETIFPEPPVRRNVSERRAYLLADKHAENVEESQVKCVKCEKWVTLKQGQPYDLARWKIHREKCSQEVPSKRVLAAERKLRITNDDQVKAFDAAHIDCAKCGSTVANTTGNDYDLAAWEEHKERCRLTPPNSPSKPVNSIPFPTESVKPPSSAASIITTLVGTETNGGGGSKPTQPAKRTREEVEADAMNEGEDERPHNRPRKDSYVPPKKEAPSPMGWFLLPLRSFVRGFRESLKNDTP